MNLGVGGCGGGDDAESVVLGKRTLNHPEISKACQSVKVLLYRGTIFIVHIHAAPA